VDHFPSGAPFDEWETFGADLVAAALVYGLTRHFI
jgi:hypothetical protein